MSRMGNGHQSLDQTNGKQRFLSGRYWAEVGVDNHEPLDLEWTDSIVIGWRRYMGDNEWGWRMGGKR